jgi:hypothetical protein
MRSPGIDSDGLDQATRCGQRHAHGSVQFSSIGQTPAKLLLIVSLTARTSRLRRGPWPGLDEVIAASHCLFLSMLVMWRPTDPVHVGDVAKYPALDMPFATLVGQLSTAYTKSGRPVRS